MSEIIENEVETTAPSASPEELKKGFTSASVKLGIFIIIAFCARGLGEIVGTLILIAFDIHDPREMFLVSFAATILLAYVVPITAGILLFRPKVVEMTRRVYVKPKYFRKAMGMLPTLYGFSIFVNFLIMWLSTAASSGGGTGAGDSSPIKVAESILPPDTLCLVLRVIHLVVIAPIFEEFLFRGVVFEEFRRYGNGVAIMVSGIVFGLFHGNMIQGLYASFIGIVLGYIAVTTGSLITTTILHFFTNSFGAILTVMLSNKEVQDYFLKTGGSINFEDVPASVMVYYITLITLLLFAAVGILMTIYKLTRIKRYRVPKVQTELSAKKRWAILLTRVTVIIGLVLTIDSIFFKFIPALLVRGGAALFSLNI